MTEHGCVQNANSTVELAHIQIASGLNFHGVVLFKHILLFLCSTHTHYSTYGPTCANTRNTHNLFSASSASRCIGDLLHTVEDAQKALVQKYEV